jgi:hypothetical protein
MASRVIKTLVWAGIGLVFLLFQLFLVVGLTGAGHGVYTPAKVLGAPFGIFYFVWPVVFGLAGFGKRNAAYVLVCVMMVHYFGVLFLPDVFSNLKDDLERDNIRGFYVSWLVSYVIGNGVLVTKAVLLFKEGHSPIEKPSPARVAG